MVDLSGMALDSLFSKLSDDDLFFRVPFGAIRFGFWGSAQL